MQNQKSVYIFISDGFETIEALTPADVLRRAGIEVWLVSIDGSLELSSSQNVKVKADMLIEDIPPLSEISAVYIPGGLPSAETLSKNETLIDLLRDCRKNNVLIASICAGPLIFNSAGLAKDIEGTCFPGFEDRVQYKKACDIPVFADGNVLSAQGAAASIYLAFALLEKLSGPKKSAEVKRKMTQDRVEKYFGIQSDALKF